MFLLYFLFQHNESQIFDIILYMMDVQPTLRKRTKHLKSKATIEMETLKQWLLVLWVEGKNILIFLICHDELMANY